ncbi:MAG: AAA family ATPase [Candidatus Altiarchaeota archaeon]|nr:AAA family ATPase [Candidatus Altiarchaeota archaeon]
MEDNLLQLDGIDVMRIEHSLWDNIVGMDVEKELIEKKILLPLKHPELAAKHGVILPKAILLFGPPGTGSSKNSSRIFYDTKNLFRTNFFLKTRFTKGIAGRLGWVFIEVSPSELIQEGLETHARELKELFEGLAHVKQAVIFFDEFEEIAPRPEKATKVERMVSNEMLKQIVRFRQNSNALIISATNYIQHLTPALLRPGRFDYILPIGPSDEKARRAMFELYLRPLNKGEIDFGEVIKLSQGFTPADIEAVCAQVAQVAFEKELSLGDDYRVTTGDVTLIIKHHKPTLTQKEIEKFRKDITRYARCACCWDCFRSPSGCSSPLHCSGVIEGKG